MPQKMLGFFFFFFFFATKLLKTLLHFCAIDWETGRFWRLEYGSVFNFFHLSVCLASGMWSFANNAQPGTNCYKFVSHKTTERIPNSNFIHRNFFPQRQAEYLIGLGKPVNVSTLLKLPYCKYFNAIHTWDSCINIIFSILQNNAPA